MENKENKTDWSKRDIGALWKREGRNQKYLSGYVKPEGFDGELKVVVFANKSKKDNDRAPDYRIYISVPLDNQNTTNSVEATSPKEVVVAAAVKTKKVRQEDEELL